MNRHPDYDEVSILTSDADDGIQYGEYEPSLVYRDLMHEFELLSTKEYEREHE